MTTEAASQRSKPRSPGVTVTATTTSSVSSCSAKGRGRPFKSQPALIPPTEKATSKLKKVHPQEVVIMREMTRYRGVKSDSGSSPAIGLLKKDESAPDEVPKVLSRHKKRKRSGFDVDNESAPTVTAAGRVGRVGRPDSPTW